MFAAVGETRAMDIVSEAEGTRIGVEAKMLFLVSDNS